MRSATGSASRFLRSSSAPPIVPVASDQPLELAERAADLDRADVGERGHRIGERLPRSHAGDEVVDEVGPRARAAAGDVGARDRRPATAGAAAPTTPGRDARARPPGRRRRRRPPPRPRSRRADHRERRRPARARARPARAVRASSTPAPRRRGRRRPRPQPRRRDEQQTRAEHQPGDDRHGEPPPMPRRNFDDARRRRARRLQDAVAQLEHRRRLDPAVDDRARRRDDLDDAAMPGALELGVHDEVDRRRDGRHHERRVDVAPGEQRQRRELRERVVRAVGVQRAHAGQPAVQGDQQVEGLRLAHLADDQPVGPHPQRLLDEPAQRDLARALEARLAALQRHPVRARRARARRSPRP